MGNKVVWTRCVFEVVIVPRKAACEYYTRMFHPLKRCVETGAGKFKGVQVGRMRTEPDHLYIVLCVPPQFAVGEIISQIKMRCHHMIRKASIARGFISETDDFKTWCPGFYVNTDQRRNRQEIAEFVREALAEDERMERPKVVEWHSDEEART